MSRRHIVIATRLAGVAALIAVPVLAWAVLSSTGGVPKFSPGRYFISQLAVPWNPNFDRLNHSFMAGGLMAVPLMLLLWRGARWPATRKAGLVGAISAVCLLFVGVFPLTKPTPHNIFAIVLAVSCAVAGALLARGIRQHLRAHVVSGLPRVALNGARLLAWLQGTCIIAGVLILLWATIQAAPGSFGEWWKTLPRYLWWKHDGGFINPLAILEWVYFGICAVLMFGVGAWSAIYGAVQSQPAADA